MTGIESTRGDPIESQPLLRHSSLSGKILFCIAFWDFKFICLVLPHRIALHELHTEISLGRLRIFHVNVDVGREELLCCYSIEMVNAEKNGDWAFHYNLLSNLVCHFNTMKRTVPKNDH